MASDPTQIDVAQLGNVAVTTPGLTSTTTCTGGLPGIQTLINALAPQLVSALANTLLAPLKPGRRQRQCPDRRRPRADPRPDQLGRCSPPASRLDVQAPWAAIDEETRLAFSFAADLTAPRRRRRQAPRSTRLPPCRRASPALLRDDAGRRHAPFDAGIGLSTAAVNAILRARTEQGLLRRHAVLDLGSGGMLTAGLLAQGAARLRGAGAGDAADASRRADAGTGADRRRRAARLARRAAPRPRPAGSGHRATPARRSTCAPPSTRASASRSPPARPAPTFAARHHRRRHHHRRCYSTRSPTAQARQRHGPGADGADQPAAQVAPAPSAPSPCRR
ncbi:MAG: hypothetical protein U0802_13955 [Candidatus Binatia bacterium]